MSVLNLGLSKALGRNNIQEASKMIEYKNIQA